MDPVSEPLSPPGLPRPLPPVVVPARPQALSGGEGLFAALETMIPATARPMTAAPTLDDTPDATTPTTGGASRPGRLPPVAEAAGDGMRAADLIGDRDRTAADLSDGLIRQMFAISLDLHAALTLIGADHHATKKITSAITGLDQAITGLRVTIFDLHYTRAGQPAPDDPGDGPVAIPGSAGILSGTSDPGLAVTCSLIETTL